MLQQDMFNSLEENIRQGQDILDDKIAVLKKERDTVHALLVNTCQHDKKYLKDESNYVSSSYYDSAYTTYWTTCTLCGKQSDSTTKTHGRYG